MTIIICSACGSELIYKRMSSTVYEIYHSCPQNRTKPTCTGAMAAIEQPVTRLDITAGCGTPGEWAHYVRGWIDATFEYPERIEITRMEIHA